ncbi:SOS response-associated peptidase, partial [Billgrantia azerbaijanica]
MCGRYDLHSDPARLSQALRLPLAQPELDLEPRYNVAPGTWIAAVRHPDADAPLVLDRVWWGFRPHWATGKAPEPINAKSEGVATSRYFRAAFARHR